MDAIAVNKKSGHLQVPDGSGRVVERFPQDDHRAIRVVGQMQNGGRARSPEGLMIAA
jgi:hypothetical protein